MKLLIGIPSNRDWKPDFGLSLLGLSAHVMRKNIPCQIQNIKNASLLSEGRQQLLDQAIMENFTHLLSIDDDTAFTTGAFDSLLKRDKDVVTANYVTKDGHHRPIARDFERKTVPSKGKTGIEKIESVGLGFCLLKMEKIKTLPRPHFEVTWGEAGYTDQDVYFCKKLCQHGIEIFVDHDATRGVRHIGNFGFYEA